MRARLQRFVLVIPIGLLVGVLVLLATSHGLRTIRGGRIGGDLPAFYGAGRIVRSGDARHLYDWPTQRAVERDLLPDSEQGWIPFPYPPFVAAMYVPLTLLPFKAAYGLHTLVMAGVCTLAVALACGLVPGMRDGWVFAAAAALGFYPLFRAVLGGQNTPFSLICAAGAAAALTRGRAFRAGVWIGAWMFKPQLALTVAAMILLRTPSRARFLAGVAVAASVYYAIAAAVAGPGWPVWWWQHGAVPFSAAERVINQENVVSFVEIGSSLHIPLVGWMLAAVAAGFAVWLTVTRSLPPVGLVALASATAVLIAPHALYYDAGLASLALIVCAGRRPRMVPLVGALWLLAWAQPFRAALPVPPLTVVVVAALAFLGYAISASGRGVAPA